MPREGDDSGQVEGGRRVRLGKNLARYRLYLVGREAYLWMPVFFLYFQQHLSLSQVLLLESVYYVAVFLLEVPSGWFSDRFGRKPTLVLSSLCLLSSYLLFFATRGDWIAWTTAQVLLAAGLAMASGTDTSLLYDTLAALGREDEYGEIEASNGRLGAWVMSLGAIGGGALAMLEPALAYAASALLMLPSLYACVAMCEPPRESSPRSIRAQLAACIALLATPRTAWLFGLGAFLVVLAHIPYEFYQPYLSLVASSEAGEEERLAPLMSGFHAAAAMFVGGLVAGWSIRARELLGTNRVLLLGAGGQVVLIALMALFLHPIMALALVGRGVTTSLTRAPLREALMPLLGDGLRATFLSLQSLTGRVLFAGVLVLLAVVERDVSSSAHAPAWSELSWKLRVASLVCAVTLVIFFATSAWARRARGTVR